MSSSFRFSSLLLASTALLAAQAQEPAFDEAVSLDTLVVSAGFDQKTAFDLAQGTSILAGSELRRRVQSTLGDTLSATAGVNATAYGPGASRPIIRGLGGDRIRVLENGVGSLDASGISPDHGSTLEPLFANQIEVLRGPATLLYGSSAIGGAVNVVDNRIPEHRALQPLGGAIELRRFGAADETTGVASLLGGSGNVAVQLNALRRDSREIDIPGVARLDADAPADQPHGTLPNSDTDTTSASLGATWFTTRGHFGAAVSSYETNYGVPVDEPVSIAMRRRRLDLHGELIEPFGIFRGAKAQFGLGDYSHREILDHTTTNTTFDNRAWEGRLELPHDLTAAVSGTWGAQATRSDFAAVGEEVATPPYVANTAALFALEEWKRGPVSFQLGGRVETQSVKLGDVSADLPPVPGYAARSGEKRRDRGVSGSAGVVYYPAKDWSTALSLAYSERLPTAQERFSNGPHGGTGAWEVGRADLDTEKSLGLELSLRKRAGFVTGSVGTFVNRFQGHIFEQRLRDDAIPGDLNEEGLTPYQFTAKDAEFYGAEAELALHLIDRPEHSLHLSLLSDYVRAQQTTDDEPLPRTPPLRFGAALQFDSARWHAGVEVRTVARQDRVAATETPTDGYTLLNADLSYTLPLDGVSCELFARGTNLTNEDARVHASFLKDFAPLPGRGVLVGLRAAF